MLRKTNSSSCKQVAMLLPGDKSYMWCQEIQFSAHRRLPAEHWGDTTQFLCTRTKVFPPFCSLHLRQCCEDASSCTGARLTLTPALIAQLQWVYSSSVTFNFGGRSEAFLMKYIYFKNEGGEKEQSSQPWLHKHLFFTYHYVSKPKQRIKTVDPGQWVLLIVSSESWK